MACPAIPQDCVDGLISNALGGLADTAFNAVVKSFVTAANTLLESFGKAFTAIPGPDLDKAGIDTIYTTSLGVAVFLAALLLIGQIIRSVLTHDGSAMAQGFVGAGKAAVAIMLTLAVARAGVEASDQLTDFIVERTFGSSKALTNKLTGMINWTNAQQAVGGASALLLLIAIVGIVLVLVLWFELLLANAAIVVLVATSPIAATGHLSESTKQWWSKTAAATAQLIMLKPVIALVFALGFGMSGDSESLTGLLSGLLILLLAVFAWPVIARFFTFASVAVGGSAGLGGLLGFAAGQSAQKAGAGAGGASGGRPVGDDPDEYSRIAETRTMNGLGRTPAMAGAGSTTGAGTRAVAGAGAGGKTAAAGGALGYAGAAALALQAGQKAINSLATGMDRTAGHADMHGRPAHYAAGVPLHAGSLFPRRDHASAETTQEHTPDEQTPETSDGTASTAGPPPSEPPPGQQAGTFHDLGGPSPNGTSAPHETAPPPEPAPEGPRSAPTPEAPTAPPPAAPPAPRPQSIDDQDGDQP